MSGHHPFSLFLLSSLFRLLHVYLPMSAPKESSVFTGHGRGQGTGERGQATEDREEFTRNGRRQGTGDKAQRIGNRGQGHVITGKSYEKAQGTGVRGRARGQGTEDGTEGTD